MNLGTETIFIVIAIALIGYAAYSTHQIKNKIYCTFIRADNTRIDKWCKKSQRRIEFDGGWYYIVPSRVILIDYDKGIFGLFPTKVASLLFRWNSSQPLDPKTFDNTYEKPEYRKQLNKEEDIRAFSEGSRQTLISQKRKNMLEGYLPIILIVGFLIIGYFVWQQRSMIDQLGLAMNTIQEMLMDLK